AEEITFGKISTGALSDLEKVTKQAYAMVSIYGLNKRIGNRSYYDSSGDAPFTKPYSEETARVIDEEVAKIIESAYERAKELLTSNKDRLEKLARKLLEREVIFKEDLEEIIGKRPYDLPETAEVAVETIGNVDAPSDDSASTAAPEASEEQKPE
ncbi:MAG: hypothetical protein RL226_1719, partial [Bacteroidota bacterium]